MKDTLPPALRLLARFWLAEVQPQDLTTIAGLPGLAEALPGGDAAALTDLAAEYHRLFGFNLPPYESLFVDPSAMLLAPATALVQALYRQANWLPPEARVGAPDHLGLELLALAGWLEAGLAGPARQLHAGHLALWAPAFGLSLRRLAPLPFYAVLGELTVDLLLATLPDEPAGGAAALFPDLPPPPVYAGRGFESSASSGESPDDLRSLVRRLLTPCQAGLYLTREDIARLSRTLDLPVAFGERAGMLETLFRLAGEYELVPALLEQLIRLLTETGRAYDAWAEEYPAWLPYAEAWQQRLADSRARLSFA